MSSSRPVSLGNLTCEYLVDPLGIDVVKPRLAWELRSVQRGQRQTAYQVLVASSAETLAADRGDLWDSGKVETDQQLHIEYQGAPLRSRMRCWWKTRVWDMNGRTSDWSEPATWSMGLLDRSDWQGLWIADAGQAAQGSPGHCNGWRSPTFGSLEAKPGEFASTEVWVSLDLGRTQLIDGIGMFPANPPDVPGGVMFPLRFKVELADRADFSDARLVCDHRDQDIVRKNSTEPALFRFQPLEGRHLRVTFTRLASPDERHHSVGLAELQVLRGAENVAAGSMVETSRSWERGAWSKAYLVDGVTESRFAPQPAAFMRQEFTLDGPVRRAVVYATARGVYELRINGQRVGDHILAPEWTEYGRRIQVQTYDVTHLLDEGPNAVAATVGRGWAHGKVLHCWSQYSGFGAYPQFLMQLHAELQGGYQVLIASDASWRGTSDGPIRDSEIYDGETYDAMREMPGWDLPSFDDSHWQPVAIRPLDDVRLVAQMNQPIRITEEIEPIGLTEPAPEVYVFDLGQNIAGWCRLKVRGRAGDVVTLCHAEAIEQSGMICTATLHGARQRDRFTLRGNGQEALEPHFTYHGFRYAEVRGLRCRPDPGDLTGIVIGSSPPQSGSFECSNDLTNRIVRATRWSLRDNLYSVMTDCPQRAERQGWLGDAQAFGQAAIYLMDLSAFLTKWLWDVSDSTTPNGRPPSFAPMPNADQDPLPYLYWVGVPGWADATTVLPWRMYENYGDRRVLAQHFELGRRWVDYVHARNPNLLYLNGRGRDWGDIWALSPAFLSRLGLEGPDQRMPGDMFGTAHFYLSAGLVARMAAVLGRTGDAGKYRRLAEDIRKAFVEEYVNEDGRLKGDSQAAYAVALTLDLVPADRRAHAVKHLLSALDALGGHPSTGLITTGRLWEALTQNGHHERACRLMNLHTCPSLGFMVEVGGTTIWEIWLALDERGLVRLGASLNHFALGSPVEWLWRHVAGINPDEDEPGYKHFFIHPKPCPEEGYSWARSCYRSIRGPITCNWRLEKGRFCMELAVPPNTWATVYVPTADAAGITESGKPVPESEGVNLIGTEQGNAVLAVQAGKYSFVAPL